MGMSDQSKKITKNTKPKMSGTKEIEDILSKISLNDDKDCFRVMEFNFDSGSKTSIDPKSGPNIFTTKLEISKQLIEYQPSLVFVCEPKWADPLDHVYYEKTGIDYQYKGQDPSQHAGFIYDATLLKFRVWNCRKELRSFFTNLDSKLVDDLFRRILFGQFFLKEDDTPLFIACSVHLESSVTDNYKENQISLLIQICDFIHKERKCHVIMGGDFNYHVSKTCVLFTNLGKNDQLKIHPLNGNIDYFITSFGIDFKKLETIPLGEKIQGDFKRIGFKIKSTQVFDHDPLFGGIDFGTEVNEKIRKHYSRLESFQQKFRPILSNLKWDKYLTAIHFHRKKSLDYAFFQFPSTKEWKSICLFISGNRSIDEICFSGNTTRS
jgi:hypothetical protein